MNPAIEKLNELSVIDTKLRLLAKECSEYDAAIEEAQAQVATAEAAIDTSKASITDTKKAADAFNLDIGTIDAKVEKLEGQLRIAKSNKEYDILKKEIADEQAKKSAIEDNILDGMEAAETHEASLKTANDNLDAAKAALTQAEKAKSDATNELNERSAELDKNRAGIVDGLEDEVRHLYESVLKQRGSALAPVKNGCCTACARKLSLQEQNIIEIGTDITQCKSCQRIMFSLEEDE